MVKPSKSKYATESFVYGVVNRSEDRLEKRIDKLEIKMENRFDKVMTSLVDIAGEFKKFDEEQVILAGRQRNHEDKIEKLEKEVFRTS